MARKYQVVLVVGAEIADPHNHPWFKDRFETTAGWLREKGVTTGQIVFLADAQQNGHQIDLETPAAQLPVPTPGPTSQLHAVLASLVEDDEPRLIVVISDLSGVDWRLVERLICENAVASYLFIMGNTKTGDAYTTKVFGASRQTRLTGQLQVVTPSQQASAIPTELQKLWDR